MVHLACPALVPLHHFPNHPQGDHVEYKSNPEENEQENEVPRNKCKNVKNQAFAVRKGVEDISCGTREDPEACPTILSLAVRERPMNFLHDTRGLDNSAKSPNLKLNRIVIAILRVRVLAVWRELGGDFGAGEGTVIESRLDLSVLPISIPESLEAVVRLRGDLSVGYFIIVGETKRVDL
ncbi:hypothetical protein L1987_43335 [Smallanthus sonchifolius]|uniref:Uncharacterized protein n=1 Tax=Smallanthus sonchifolius TaxID=185202 RepID=A0ACB9GMC6_9ASTR|nr:hypothetical protein L1987_43335 [Smallanthus sonchifolius]